MNCSVCRRQVHSDARFCSSCGARIAETSNEHPAFEPFVKATAVAKLVGCSEIKIRRMAGAGQIPAVAFPVGLRRKTWRFRMSAVQRWLDDLERKLPRRGVGRQRSQRPEAALASGRSTAEKRHGKAQ